MAREVFEKLCVRLEERKPITLLEAEYLRDAEYLRIDFQAATNLTDPEPACPVPVISSPERRHPVNSFQVLVVCVTGIQLPGAMPMPGERLDPKRFRDHARLFTANARNEGNKLLVWRFDRQTGYRASQALHGQRVPRSASLPRYWGRTPFLISARAPASSSHAPRGTEPRLSQCPRATRHR